MKSKQFMRATLALAVIGLVTWFVWRWLLPTDVAEITMPDALESESFGLITLTDHKRAIAGIQTERVRIGEMKLSRTLPARFAYDDTRHVTLRTPTDGVLQSVLVQPGDAVQIGQPVAVLRSPAIGQARSQVLAKQASVELASKVYQREKALFEGVAELAKRMRAGESVDSIKRDVADRSLGEYGGTLLSAYSQSRLATNLSESIGQVGDSGAISGRVVRERETQKQQAQASLESSIDQSLYQTQQAMATAQANLEQAERDLRIAQQTLGNLVAATPSFVNGLGFVDGLNVSPNEIDVSKLTITSPISGTIESKTFSATERVSAGEELYVIADTNHLWVEADIRGRDWNSIRAPAGETVWVTTPSVDLPPQPARVLYVGRQVDPASGAIPLVASIENIHARFRPGLFAHVQVPTKTLSGVMTVPESALMDLNGKPSVFVSRDNGFAAIEVEAGATSDGRIEIRSGLNEGDLVVVAGAFTLKSELLLQGEE